MRTGSSFLSPRPARRSRTDGVFQAAARDRGTSTDKSVCATLGSRRSRACCRYGRINVAQTLLSVRSGRIERFIASAGIATHEINGSTLDRGVAPRSHLACESAVARADRSRIVRCRNREDDCRCACARRRRTRTRRSASASRRTFPPPSCPRSSASWRWSRAAAVSTALGNRSRRAR